MRVRSVVMSVVFAGVAACHSSPPATAPSADGGSVLAALRRSIDSMADAPEFSNAHWGILIVDPERGDTLYSRNAGKIFMPASNMKILTSATALARLGPEYRYHTVFAALGPVENGTLDGDLLVFGRGDPTVSDHMLHDAMIPLRLIADSIAAHGIRRIRGRIKAVGDAFPGPVLGFGWSWDDFQDSYSAPIDELLFNEGFSVLHVRGGDRNGVAPHVDVTPAHTYPKVQNEAMTGGRAMDVPAGRPALRAFPDSTRWETVLEGNIAPRDTASIEVTHHDPDVAYIAALHEALVDRGITIDGATLDRTATIDTLAVLSSPTLREILPALMKPSQNQIAEMLFRTIALEATGVGRADSAQLVVQRQIAQWGVPPSEAVIRDGSGLSRYDYVSPRTIVRVLNAVRHLPAPSFAAYYDALPIAGVDGTISSRMKGTAAEGNVHAKTGTLAQARSLSGYVTTANHRMLIFSFLCNNWTVPTRAVEQVQDAIAERLAAMQLP